MRLFPDRPAWTKSLRLHLTAWYLATLTLILTLAGALLFLGLRDALLRETDASLSAQAAQIARLLVPAADEEKDEDALSPAAVLRQTRPTPALSGIPRETMLVRIARRDANSTAAMSPGLSALPGLSAALAADAAHVPLHGVAFTFAGPTEETQARCLTTSIPRSPYVVQVAMLWDNAEDLLARLMAGILFAELMLLLVSGIGSWLLVSRALRPIDAIATEAEHLAMERSTLATHLCLSPRKASDNEIGHLVRALDGMMARLTDAFRTQRRFTADASHELRTPLTILQGEFELTLTRPRSEEDYRRALSSGLEEIQRMARIVDSLSLLARSDEGAPLTVPFVSVPLKAIAAEVVQSFTSVCAKKNLHLTMTADEAAVRGDADSLRRLLRNLLENAVRYTPSGGAITVVVRVEGEDCEISVTDTGVGIAESDLPHVFTRFYRADAARVNTGGSGLGLSIARSIAEAHGGEINAVSAPGQGTRMQVRLPNKGNAE